MHRQLLLLSSVMTVIAVIAFAMGCGGGRSDGDGDENEMSPDCASYLAALNHCLGTVGHTESQRASSTRRAFIQASQDQAAREHLAAQCRAANQQLSRTCQ